MSDVRHEGFRVRLLIEQVVSTPTHAASPVDPGRIESIIVLHEANYPIKDIELSEFLINPLTSLQQLIEYERSHGRSGQSS